MFKFAFAIASIMAFFVLCFSSITTTEAQSTQPAGQAEPGEIPKIMKAIKPKGKLFYQRLYSVESADDGQLGSISMEIYKEAKTGTLSFVTNLDSTFRGKEGFKTVTIYRKLKGGAYQLNEGWSEIYIGPNVVFTGHFIRKPAHIETKGWKQYDHQNDLKLPMPVYEYVTLNTIPEGPLPTRFNSFASLFFLFPEKGIFEGVNVIVFPDSPRSTDVFELEVEQKITRRGGANPGETIIEVSQRGRTMMTMHYDKEGKVIKIIGDRGLNFVAQPLPGKGKAATQPAATQPSNQ